MEKPWLQSYPPSVPADIDPERFSSLREVLEESCRRFAERPAFTNMGTTLRYRDLDRLSRDFGAYLTAGLGLAKGERVALMMPNVLAYPVTLFGVLRSGLTAVNVNPLYTPRELRHQLRDSGARAIVILENFAHTLEQVLDDTEVEHVVIARIGDLHPGPKGMLVNAVVRYVKKMVPRWSISGTIPLGRALAEGARQPLEGVPLGPDDIAFLQYTGGTTGVAKGAILTHRNMVANLEQAGAWLGPWARQGEEVIITALPLYHIFSLLANCLTFMSLGGENVLITNPRDMPGFVKELRKVPFTAITGVNTLFNGLLNNPDFASLDFSHLRLTLGGGMAVQHSVAERWQQTTGVVLLEAYGLTETSPAVCINPLDLPAYNGSIGLPVPSTEVAVMDEEGNQLGPDTIGELCVRGPQVTQGYWNRPRETRSAFHADGWFRTGDMARIDVRGFVYIVDRAKDMILVSGFNVFPNEVEGVIAEHPDVLEVAVVGVSDGNQGERVKAVIVPRGEQPDRQGILDYCRQNLTAYKVPKEIEFREELPKTNVGKILRRALREGGGGGRDAA